MKKPVLRTLLRRLAVRLGLRWGVTRVVVLLGRHAYKLPNPFGGWHNFIIGIHANLCESANWYAFSTCLADDPRAPGKYLLCPVTWTSWGGWLLVMRRVDRLLTEQEGRDTDLAPWAEMDLEGDDKHTNYGWLDGRVVKLDYGHFAFVVRFWDKGEYENLQLTSSHGHHQESQEENSTQNQRPASEGSGRLS